MGQRTSQREAAGPPRAQSEQSAPEQVFDRQHLEHYTMHNQELALEVLNLFLTQMPATLALLDEARTATEWTFATHTLKGSAAAVGAGAVRRLAAEMEASEFRGDDNVRLLRVQALKAAVAEFRAAARRAYPTLA